ncbi:MAG: hypothetical protein RL754_1446, partial [Bacteroidota bacterium]
VGHRTIAIYHLVDITTPVVANRLYDALRVAKQIRRNAA